MNILIVSHGSDNDGYASAAYADHFLSTTGHEVSIIGVDYGDKMPAPETLFAAGADADLIFVCDFVLEHEVMEEWHAQGKLIWIDHHKSSIEDSLKHEYHKAPGIRRIGTAACKLTYDYLNNEFSNFGYIVSKSGLVDQGPAVLRYLAKYDVFEKDHLWDTHTMPIQYACKASAHELAIGSEKFREAWAVLLNITEEDPLFAEMQETGIRIAGYQRELDAELSSAVHTAKIEIGGYDTQSFRFLALNGGSGVGPFLNADKEGFDGMLVYKFTGTEWKISLYGWDGSPDLSAVAKEFGGGGHRHAAGMSLKSLSPTISISPLREVAVPGETPEAPAE